MYRKIALILVIVYVALAAAVATALHQASPAPAEQAISGIALGNGTERVYISSRRLDCAPQRPSQCSLDIGGATLTVVAQPDATNALAGTCAARYASSDLPCSLGMRHVHTSAFAFIDAPAALSAPQLTALRQQFWIENLPEGAFLRFIPLAALLSAAVAAGAVLLWYWPLARHRVLVVGMAGAAGLLATAGSGIIAAIATSGFWD